MSSEMRAKAEKCLAKTKFVHLDGILYQQWSSPYPFDVSVERLRKLPMRSDDVIIHGFPRSGNHWTYHMTSMILRQATSPNEKSFIDSLPDLWSDEQYAQFAAEPSPRVMSSHTRPRRYLLELLDKKPKMIFTLRNPKDSVVSYHKLCSGIVEEYAFQGTWSEYFDIYLAGEMSSGSWFDHILSFDEFLENYPDIPVHIHQFEKVLEDPVLSIQKLCSFLGYDSSEIAEDISKATELENLKKTVQSQKSTNDRFFDPNSDAGFIQKGIVGNWRKTFTVDQNIRFNKVFEEKMSDSKLAALIREYI